MIFFQSHFLKPVIALRRLKRLVLVISLFNQCVCMLLAYTFGFIGKLRTPVSCTNKILDRIHNTSCNTFPSDDLD
jgi:hypothetical protein